MKRILITGASGFIGSFLVEKALELGYETWAGVRATSSRAYLKHPDIRFVELNLARPDMLLSQLAAHRNQYGDFDCVVHAAGVTKCVDRDDFERVNYRQTRELADALIKLDMVPRRFVLLSSLSVFGPLHEDSYLPLSDLDVPQPNTAYGRSKLLAENYLRSLPGFPYVALRPTGVYGPREKDYYLMMKSIRRHLDVAVGCKRQDLTFVYVRDVAQAVFKAIDSDVCGRAYALSDGQVYQSREFSDLIARELGNPRVLRLTFPLWSLRAVSTLTEGWGRLTHKGTTLNLDKYRIMKQRNWRCDITPARQDLGYQPEYPLDRGVSETIAWYKKEGWL